MSMSISDMSYGTDKEFEASTRSEDFMVSEFVESGTGVIFLGVLVPEEE